MSAIEDASKVLDAYISALRAQDWEKLKNCFHCDEALSYIGTDAGEMWVGWEDAEPYLKSQVQSFERVVINREERQVREVAGLEAVLFVEKDEMMITMGGTRHDIKVRLTGIVEKRNGRWAIGHLHRSIPSHKPAVVYKEYPAIRF